jgi:hypothetical protein
MEGHDGVFRGREEIRAWWENLHSLNGASTVSDCQVEGETVTSLFESSLKRRSRCNGRRAGECAPWRGRIAGIGCGLPSHRPRPCRSSTEGD